MKNLKNKLTLIHLLEPNKTNAKRGLYLCECGNTKAALLNNVKMGNTTSCGCVQRAAVKKSNSTHGGVHHPLYTIWASMKSRCYNKNHKAYKFYGAKGVTVCDEWKNDFKAFYDWAILNGWEKGLEIDKDIKCTGYQNKIYSPQTVSITSKFNNLSFIPKRKPFKTVEFNGQIRNLFELSIEFNINYETLKRRILRGWSLEDALNTKRCHKRNLIVF